VRVPHDIDRNCRDLFSEQCQRKQGNHNTKGDART
jgi:hypothetical protein